MNPESLRAILKIARNAFVSLDEAGRVLEWNPRAEELFGYTREQALGKELAVLIVPPRYRARHRQALRRALAAVCGEPAASGPLHVEARRQDGSEFPVEVTVAAMPAGHATRVHGWIQDVSERAELLAELETQLRGGAPGFGEILDALAEAVTIRNAYHHILYANRAALRLMQFESLEELQRRPPHSIFDDYAVQDEHGRELTMDDIPSVRLLAGAEAEPLVLRTIHRQTGVLRWEVLKASALRGSDGMPVATVTIIEDITSQKLAELQERFLARASETLMSSLDHEETLRNVAALAVPELADWCAVDLVDEDGHRRHVAVAHQDPGKLALAERLREYEPEEPDPEQGLGRVLRTGVAELYEEVPPDAVAQSASSPEHLKLLQQLGLRSVILVPLRTRGRTLGAMTLITADTSRRLGPGDLDFAQALADRAAVAVDNARLATTRRRIASTLQRSLLPESVPAIEGWRIATLYRAAGGAEEVEVGGDFYDFVETDGGWIVLLGDIAGKGVEAATMTSLVRHGARFMRSDERTPSRILARLNEALCDQPGMWLCTALCVSLQGTEAVISTAGHPPPLIVGPDGRVKEVKVSGPILGAWRGGRRDERTVKLTSDQTMLMYTDGVIDTFSRSGRFGTSRLRATLKRSSTLDPVALLAELEQTLDRFQDGAQADDTAAIALRPVAAPDR